ncbi:hypothetical protein T484DRAFT_1796357 [Baffinella frigidus]|nr:hypothetical protein T484DRAFT_1796357 [Cryptophyta sp. CCMP2293]
MEDQNDPKDLGTLRVANPVNFPERITSPGQMERIDSMSIEQVSSGGAVSLDEEDDAIDGKMFLGNATTDHTRIPRPSDGFYRRHSGDSGLSFRRQRSGDTGLLSETVDSAAPLGDERAESDPDEVGVRAPAENARPGEDARPGENARPGEAERPEDTRSGEDASAGKETSALLDPDEVGRQKRVLSPALFLCPSDLPRAASPASVPRTKTRESRGRTCGGGAQSAGAEKARVAAGNAAAWAAEAAASADAACTRSLRSRPWVRRTHGRERNGVLAREVRLVRAWASPRPREDHLECTVPAREVRMVVAWVRLVLARS